MYDEEGTRYLDCINNVAHGEFFSFSLINFKFHTFLFFKFPQLNPILRFQIQR